MAFQVFVCRSFRLIGVVGDMKLLVFVPILLAAAFISMIAFIRLIVLPGCTFKGTMFLKS